MELKLFTVILKVFLFGFFHGRITCHDSNCMSALEECFSTFKQSHCDDMRNYLGCLRSTAISVPECNSSLPLYPLVIYPGGDSKCPTTSCTDSYEWCHRFYSYGRVCGRGGTMQSYFRCTIEAASSTCNSTSVFREVLESIHLNFDCNAFFTQPSSSCIAKFHTCIGTFFNRTMHETSSASLCNSVDDIAQCIANGCDMRMDHDQILQTLRSVETCKSHFKGSASSSKGNKELLTSIIAFIAIRRLIF